MPSIYDLKPRFQSLLRPLVRRLAEAGVSANHVTIAAVLLSFLIGGLIALNPMAKWPLLLMPIALFIRMALNAIDGMLAREHGMKSSLGAILNEIGDVLSDTALYLPIALVPGMNSLWVVDGCRARDCQRDDRHCRSPDRRSPAVRRTYGEKRSGFCFRLARSALGHRHQLGSLG